MVDRVPVKGLKELDRALAKLDKTTGAKVLRGALYDATLPMFKAARANAAATGVRGFDVDALAAAMSRWSRVLKKRTTAVFIGPRTKSKKALALYNDLHDTKIKGIRHGHLVEFGSQHGPAQPFLRPAFDSNKRLVVSRFSKRLATRIDKVRASR